MVYPLCFLPFLGLFLWNWPSNFPPYWVCVDLVTMSCCFQAPRQWCWCFRPPVLRFLVIFFHPTDRPTQSQETYSTLNERKGDDLSLMVSFGLPHHIASAYFCILVFCFVLFFFCRWNNWNWNCSNTLYIPFGDSRGKKMKSAMIYWPQGQWGGVRAR